MSTFIHGIAASENIDSSGEVVSIAGMDISMLDKTGVFNYEHDQATGPNGEKLTIKLPSNVVGKILKAKKIFSEQDCEDERQLYFWNKVKTPFVYAMGELLDDYKESAKEVAGMFRYDADRQNQNEHDILGFSIEGNNLKKDGMMITRSIARKLTITVGPCNKACVAEMMPEQGESQVRDDIDSIFKSETVEIELFKSDQMDQMYEDFLAKKEQAMQKADPKTLNGPAKAPMAPQAPAKTTTAGMVHGWKASISQHSGGTNVNFEHPKHGMVTVHKNPESGNYEVKHNGAPAGLLGNKGIHPDAATAVGHAKKYVHAVNNGTVAGKRMMNANSNMGIEKKPMDKAEIAGSANVAPSQLTGTAALAKEDVQKKMQKSDWLARAEEAYQSWEKKEQFESFMQKRLPHLAKGEVEAIGKTLALKKSLDAEKSLGEIMEKALKFGSEEDQKAVEAALAERAKNPPKKSEPKKKAPELKSVVHSEVSHTSHYSDKHEIVHLKSGHEVHGVAKGKFKAGDKVVAKPHLMGTVTLDHHKK